MSERLDQVKAEIDKQAELTGDGYASYIGRRMRLTIFGIALELGQGFGMLSEGETNQAREHLLNLRDKVSA